MTREEIESKIDYLERLMNVCSVSTSELRELEELKKKLLESEEENEKENN